MSSHMLQPDKTPPSGESFDEVVLPHLDAAYRLARWLMRNEHDAEDVVQEASLRAFRYFRTFTGGNARAWFLKIVRNTCSGWRAHQVRAAADLFDEERHNREGPVNDPETLLIQADVSSAIERAIGGLPDRSRQLLVLREVEGMSYRELADAMDIPMGTVMSGLSRARQAFRTELSNHLKSHGDRPATHRREEAGAVPA
jgi:RNA polymerase sigma-70 factor, ECF subfamily